MPQPQLPQISRDVLRIVFKTPEAVRAYEALQQALINAPETIVTLGDAVSAARDQAEAAINKAAQASLQATQATTRAGFGLASTRDASGQTLAVVPEALVMSLLPYLPHNNATASAPRAGLGISIALDAAGATISVIPEQLIAGILPFLPKQTPARPVDDAQAVIANQVFGAR